MSLIDSLRVTVRDSLIPYKTQLDRTEQRDLLEFVRSLFPGYRANWHHELIADRLMAIERGEISRLVITMPPRFGKSELASVNFPAWYLGRNPDKRVIACSNTARLANRFSRLARNKVSHYQWAFPRVRLADDQANIESWDLQGYRGGYIAAGVGGQVTGFGADLIIVDDAVKSAAQALSETYRESTWEWYTETLRTRLEPNGAIVVIGTRWHEDDLIGRLLLDAEEGWEVINLPALLETGESLWPNRWPVAALDRIRRAVGSYAWNAQYQGAPQPSEGGLFKRHWWRFWQPSGAELPPVTLRMPDGRLQKIEPRVLPGFWEQSAQSWDMTFKKTESGSYVVGLAGFQLGANSYLVDCFRDRVEFTDAVRAVQSMTQRHPEIDAKLIEDKANGPAIIDTLRDSISGIIAIETDGSKEARAQSSTARVEAGNWYLPHPEIAPWVDDFINELAAFPTGRHDDQVDAFTQLDRYFYGGGDYSELDAYMDRQLGRA